MQAAAMIQQAEIEAAKIRRQEELKLSMQIMQKINGRINHEQDHHHHTTALHRAHHNWM